MDVDLPEVLQSPEDADWYSPGRRRQEWEPASGEVPLQQVRAELLLSYPTVGFEGQVDFEGSALSDSARWEYASLSEAAEGRPSKLCSPRWFTSRRRVSPLSAPNLAPKTLAASASAPAFASRWQMQQTSQTPQTPRTPRALRKLDRLLNKARHDKNVQLCLRVRFHDRALAMYISDRNALRADVTATRARVAALRADVLRRRRNAEDQAAQAADVDDFAGSAACLREAAACAAELRRLKAAHPAPFAALSQLERESAALEARAPKWALQDRGDWEKAQGLRAPDAAEAAELRRAGFCVADLRAAGFGAAALRGGGYEADALCGLVTAAECVAALYDVEALAAAGFFAGAAEARAAGCSVDDCLDAALLETLEGAAAAGFNARDCLAAHRLFGDAASVAPGDRRTAAARQGLKSAKASPSKASPGKSLGTASPGNGSHDAGAAGDEEAARRLAAAGFTVANLRFAGFSVSTLERAGLLDSCGAARAAGFSAKALLRAGRALRAVADAGYHQNEIEAACTILRHQAPPTACTFAGRTAHQAHFATKAGGRS